MTDEENIPEEEIVAFEPPDVSNEIIAACTAYETVETIDETLLSPKVKKQRKEIMEKSIDIIHKAIAYMHETWSE